MPIANGTRPDCWSYTWWNETKDSQVPSVSTAAWLYEFELGFLLDWNEGLRKDGNVQPSSSYCVALAKAEPTVWLLPSPRAPDEALDCAAWFPAITNCQAHLKSLRLSLDTFHRWNPSVKGDCSIFINGTYYCYRSNSDEPDTGGGSPTSTSTTSASSITKASSTTSTTKSGPTETSKVSPNGACGGKDGYTCQGSLFGDCCSSSNFCGSSNNYCGAGCQTNYGKCNAGSYKISPDGTCGGTQKWN